MDSVFYIKGDACTRFLRDTARAIGCTYICLWAYVPHPSNCLVSMEGWYNAEDNSRPSSSSGGLSQLFDAYRRSFCSVESGCVPGLAFQEGHAYLELGEQDLMNSAAILAQRQFYQEAGIKTAVFMGCRSGELELGMLASTNINKQVDVRSLFTEDFVIQQSQMGELFLQDQSRPSSSSSSLRSLSVGSPEYSSLLLSKANTSYIPDVLKETSMEQTTQITPTLVPPHQMTSLLLSKENTSYITDVILKETSREQVTQITPTLVPPHQMNMQAYSRFRNPASDDAAMTRAMLAVISWPSSSSSSSSVVTSQYPDSRQVRSFKPYNSALAPKFECKPTLSSQRMLKMAFSILRKIDQGRAGTRFQEARPTTNQLHHVISERKRREKLKESINALRLLLPPGSKNDNASVLANTKDYLSTLKAQISDLEEKNRKLEMCLLHPEETSEEVGTSTQRVNVQIIKASESTSDVQQISLRVIVRVECEMINLVLRILECLKEMRDMNLVSMEANTYTQQTDSFRRAILTLRIQADKWDQESFKEAVTRAVDEVAQTGTANP